MNIYEVAREAGVSIATVSRVVNGKTVVSTKTREKVEVILNKYNYTPNPNARNLAAGSTRSVAILTSDIRDAYCAGVCREVELNLRKIGYSAILLNTSGNSNGIKEAFKTALFQRMDAVIAVGMSKEADSEIKEGAKNISVVVINNFIDSPNVHCVICDESYGMMFAVSHLVYKRKSDILFVLNGSDASYTSLQMTDGFENGMKMYDLSAVDRTVICEAGFDGGYSCAQKLMNEHRKFDGIICDDDTTAAGFMKALRENFFAVPEDVAVLSFHNTDVAKCVSPSLTSVDCQSGKAGEEAVNLLKKLFNKESAEAKVVVLPRLIIREST